MPQPAQPTHRRLNTYVEADLAQWVAEQAARQGRTTSGWLRILLVRVREEMLQDGSGGGSISGTALTHLTGEEA